MPALIARQAGGRGLPAAARSRSRGSRRSYTLTRLSPRPSWRPRRRPPGAPSNPGLARPYNNLAVPGATVVDALTRTTDAAAPRPHPARAGHAGGAGGGRAADFVTVWIGNNDVLGAAMRGRAMDGVTLTPAAAFRAAYQQLIAALQADRARAIVAANLPDVTAIPFVTTIRAVRGEPRHGPAGAGRRPAGAAARARTGPLPPGTLVTLAAATLLAQGIGIPTSAGGRGTPLPDEVILDPAEIVVPARPRQREQPGHPRDLRPRRPSPCSTSTPST